MEKFEEQKLVTLKKDEIIFETNITLIQNFDSENSCILRVTIPDNVIEIVADNFFHCLYKLKEQYPNILMYCKGYKENVYPSRMALQMSSGLMAYEMKMGYPAKRNDLVNIFDFEDTNLTVSNKKQEEFFKNWIKSL